MPLIEALITEHRYRLPGSGGGISAGFGSNGVNGFSAGGGPKTIERRYRNDQVLSALTAIHPGVNYVFDQSGWRRWYIQQQTPETVDLRRGGF